MVSPVGIESWHCGFLEPPSRIMMRRSNDQLANNETVVLRDASSALVV